MAAAPRIKTTVVGSYPVPDWLLALPSEQALIDATRVVIHTQEQAGIDLVCDGEFSRFDVNHPETNGMIEYFVRPMAGMRTAITFDELVAYRSQRGMGFRTRPPAVVESAGGRGKGGDECLLWHRRRCLCASHGALSNLQEVSVRTAEYCLGSPYAYGAPSAPTIAAENRTSSIIFLPLARCALM